MNDLTIYEDKGLMPALTINDAVARYNAVVEFTKRVMKVNKDYGVIPGTGDKPTLLKPGAEKLCSLFGLVPEFEIVDKITDFDKGIFYFHYSCRLSRNGHLVATGEGSANSKEKKYRYRNVPENKASEEDKATAIRAETRSGRYGQYKVYVVENTEPFDLINTLQKMAQKRALVAATLIAANASEFFTQDIEDMEAIEGDFTEQPEPNQEPHHSAPPPRKAGKAGNGASWNPVKILTDEGISDNGASASQLLNKYIPKDIIDNKDKDALVAWGKRYRGWRDMEAEPDKAAENATEGIDPPG